MRILAIDPGPTASAFVLFDTEENKPIWFKFLENKDSRLGDHWLDSAMSNNFAYFDAVAIEMIQGMGMPVGSETFDTCRWIGRFEQMLYPAVPLLCFRTRIKAHICGTTKAKDGNVRQALIDRLGPVGTKKNPGPLYGVSNHIWAALAVAVYAADNYEQLSKEAGK